MRNIKEVSIKDKKIAMLQGDIVDMNADAIVNAANNEL